MMVDPVAYVLLVLAAAMALGLLTCMAVEDICARLAWAVDVYRALGGGKPGLKAAWMAFGDDSHINAPLARIMLPRPRVSEKELPALESLEDCAPLEPDDLVRTLVHPDRRTYEGQHYLAGNERP